MVKCFDRASLQTLIILTILTISACTKYVPQQRTVEPPLKGQLTLAAAKGNLGEVIEILAQGADINENLGTDEEAVTPLFAALVEGHDDIAKYLLSQGATHSMVFKGYTARDMIFLLDKAELMDRLRGLHR